MRKRRGFTLIELMITVAIVAILATVAVPLAQMAVQRTKEQELRYALRQIREAIDRYKQLVDSGRIAKLADESGYPKSLEVLVDGVEDKEDSRKGKIYLLRKLPRDPLAQAVPGAPLPPAAATWGRRSYASPPNAPRAGEDVFDVYSLAPGTGLNGIPYRDW